MHLTNIDVRGKSVPVDVSESGVFTATFADETFEAGSLAQLHNNLVDALIASRADVPFVSKSGRRGRMRGFHAGNYDVLVTWEDGTKGRMPPSERVFRADEIEEETVEELRRLQKQRGEVTDQIQQIQARARTEGRTLLAEALGEDVADSRRVRDAVAT